MLAALRTGPGNFIPSCYLIDGSQAGEFTIKEPDQP
jgi:hypothetical protein